MVKWAGTTNDRTGSNMAHLTVRNGFARLVDRINLYPQGAPPAETLYRILQLLFSEAEAALVARLPIKPFTAAKAARLWKKSESEARKVLDALAARGILVDSVPEEGPTVYFLPPPMAGFFEFSMMRVRGDIDQKLLAELFYQYLNVEEDFIKQLFCNGETQLGRVFVNETALSAENSLHVLDFERAAEIVRTAQHIGVGICYCRHKMEHVGRACAAEQDICLTFNNTAASLTRHGIARGIDAAEGLDLLQKARAQRLGAIRRECAPLGQLHLQLLRLLLRGHDRGAPFRVPAPGPYQQLHAGGRRSRLQRLRQVRGSLPGGGPGPGHGQRPRKCEKEGRPGEPGPVPRLRRLRGGLPR